MKDIDSIIQILFENIAHTKKTDKARHDIKEALKKQFEKELKNHNSIQAMGLIMTKYDTLEKAGELAGYSKDDIKAWKDNKHSVSKKEFQKIVRKVRWNIYIFAMGLIFCIVSVANLMLFSDLFYLAPMVVFAIPTIVCFRKGKKYKAIYDYEHLRLSTEAYEFYQLLSDRYSKRLLNSVYILIVGFFVLLFSGITFRIQAKSKPGEIVQIIWMNIPMIEFVMYLVLKNFLCRKWFWDYKEKQIQEKYIKSFLKVICVSVLYWILVSGLLLLLHSKIEFLNNYFFAAVILYFVGCFVYNLTARKKIVKRNLVRNKRRIVFIGILVVAVSSYELMQTGSWLIQPYVSSVPRVSHKEDKIKYNDDNGVYTITTDKKDFKILQLTDIHLGGSTVSAMKDYKALKAVYKLISKTHPDLVVVTGDLVFPLGVMSFSLNNTTPMIQFASFMRNIGIPWAFLYGNHDTENVANGSVETVKDIFKAASFKTSQNLLYPYVQPDITGRNNQLIELRNEDGSLNQALFLLDSNDYTGSGVNDYDYIHDDEIAWYKKQVQRLNALEKKTVSSMLFFHMPLQEYRTAYELYEKKSDKVTYFFGENGEKMIDKVCCSDYPSKLFNTAVELGSTKAMFCGHDHYNNLSVEYKGIRLTYGMSIDYLAMPGIENDTKQRGGTLITVHKDSTYDIRQVPLSLMQ
ncbi:MAG: metallophosphoesterase family protein [Anaerostipes sp.]|nr:metallophosphoesterase family protein [Anaerostipes sp.]